MFLEFKGIVKEVVKRMISNQTDDYNNIILHENNEIFNEIGNNRGAYIYILYIAKKSIVWENI